MKPVKICQEGVFFFANGHSTITRWGFDTGGESFATPKPFVKACLLHIAAIHGITLVAGEDSPEQLSLDSERAALDAIALVRWKGGNDVS